MQGVQNKEISETSHHHGVDSDNDVKATKNAQSTTKSQAKTNDQNTVCKDTAASTAQQSQQNDPTEGSRVPTGNTEGYAKDPTAALKNNPEYQDVSHMLDLANQLEVGQGFYYIDAQFGGWCWSGLGDGIIDRGNIEDAARDPNARGHAAAVMLLANPRLFTLIDKDGDGQISSGELQALIEELKAKKKKMEDDAAAKALPPPNSTLPVEGGQESQPPVEEKKQPGVTEQQLKAETPRPTPSKATGLDGAAENINNMLGWTEAEMDRLSKLYTETDDPKMQKMIENKINALSRMSQQIAAMLNQIMTLMSNISKMQSDIAMNSIRNLR